MPCGGAGCGDDRGKWAFYTGDVDGACNVPRCMYLSYTPFCLLNISSEVKYIGCCGCLARFLVYMPEACVRAFLYHRYARFGQ